MNYDLALRVVEFWQVDSRLDVGTTRRTKHSWECEVSGESSQELMDPGTRDVSGELSQ